MTTPAVHGDRLGYFIEICFQRDMEEADQQVALFKLYEEDVSARASALIQVNFVLVSPRLRKG